MAIPPRVYVKTHSVKLPAAGGGNGILRWCASYDPGGGTAWYRVFKVAGFIGDVPQTGLILSDSSLSLAPATSPYNREEVGYGWPENQTTIPNTFGGSPTPNGLYAIQVAGAQNDWASSQNAYFLVRRPGMATKALVCYPYSTNVAYAGGDAGTHCNLYDSFEWKRTRRVSLDRPFKNWAFGSDKDEVTIRFPFLMEQFIRNYKGIGTVDVCTSFDLHADPGVLTGFQLFVSVGHDEYWSKEMRDRVEAFVAAGGNAAFFSANTAWWQVRFENGDRTMVCNKTAVEDPFAGSDDTRVTANFSSSPPSRPENTLTGVSYRRGTQGTTATPYSILMPSHPYFTGVAGPTFGSGLFVLETDAADCALQNGVLKPTGADGTPLNLEVLADADMRTSSLAQRGRATLGRFTNHGTVFTAGTTHWAPMMSPSTSDVAKITRNVLDDLYIPQNRPAWTLPTRTYPIASWTSLGALSGAVAALCGIVEGYLVTQRSGSVYRRDPENPGSSDTVAPIPARTDLVSYGSDLWGRLLYAGADDGKVYSRSGSVFSSDGWSATPLNPPVSGCRAVGVAGHDAKIFVVLQSVAVVSSTLYRIVNGSWTRLGRVYPPIRPIASFDGKLFGVQDPGSNTTDALDLYCREASEVDLLWTKVGTAPAGTYALAAYYGRLYALAGASATNPTLYWRAAVPSVTFPYRASPMLFLSGSTYAFGRLASNGDFETAVQGSLGITYTQVTRVNDGLVFFYNSADGSGAVLRFNADGSYVKLKSYLPGSFGTWTHVIYLRAGRRVWTDLTPVQEKVLFYNSAGTSVYIGYFNPTTGAFVSQWNNSAFSTGWTHITCTYKGDLLFFNGSTGSYSWGSVDNAGSYYNDGSGSGMGVGWQTIVPAGHTYLLFYRSDGTAALRELLSGLTERFTLVLSPNRKTAGCSNGSVIGYDASTGAAAAYGFSATAITTLRDHPAAAFATGWQTILGIGIV
jgi:hypothetical protein